MNNNLFTIMQDKCRLAMKIVDYFTDKGIKIETSTAGTDEKDQKMFIYIYPYGVHDLAFTYNLLDEEVDIAAVLELATSLTKDKFNIYKEEFNKDNRVFDSFKEVFSEFDVNHKELELGKTNKLYLYNTLNYKEITNEYLDKLYDFLLNKNDFFINLSQACEKNNY